MFNIILHCACVSRENLLQHHVRESKTVRDFTFFYNITAQKIHIYTFYGRRAFTMKLRRIQVLPIYLLYYTGVRCIHAEVVEPELGSIGLFLFRHVRYPLFESFLSISIHYNSCCILDRPQDISRTVSSVDT